jgi:dipeptidyl aminopeptidase/acylaminoacyl peptidase
MFSPDGRLLAYTSSSSGRFEVYVDGVPEPGTRIQVSANGGSSARWRPDGKELFYLAPDGTLTAVPVRSMEPLEFGPPVALFQFFSSIRGAPAGIPSYDITPDGQRFIVSSIVRQTDPSIEVLLNWPALMTAGTAQ